MSDTQTIPADELDALKATNEYVFDAASAEPVKHVWIDRGLKLSCENAGHPYHQAWKKDKPIKQ